ncbi:MAG: carboxypeptidase-like regulatory domain-containing protein [Opitutae bacterium]|nr:carboxypeptidase-like regulatory domain-containing protein [Opitutae bacterium]
MACLAPAHAQLSGDGILKGRVFNPAAKQYVNNAVVAIVGTNLSTLTTSDGSYTLSNVPTGVVTVSVDFTGYNKLEEKVMVSKGQTTTKDFDLIAVEQTEILKLETFVVSAERQGNAKALMDQRAAMNAKSVVSSDNFGDITGGNMGEFVKYLPGVVIDYADADARGLRIGGLNPEYAAVTMNGQRVASAASAQFGSGSRAFDLEQASIVDVESIELNKTITASMDADAPAGTLNMKSKNAFTRKGREIVVATSLSASSYEMNFNKSPGPGDGEHRKIEPGFIVSYANSFNDRFGLVVSLGHYGLFNEQSGASMSYALPSAARGLVLNTISLRDSPKISTRDVFTLNMDYKLMPGLVVSLNTQGTHFEDDINSHLQQFLVANAQVTADSTLSNTTALDSGNINTRVNTQGGNVNKFNDTFTISPKVEFRHNAINVTVGASYSRSMTHYEDRRSGYFSVVGNRISRMSWNATRPNSASADWTFTQLSGRPWGDIASYNRDDANTSNVQTGERVGGNFQKIGFADAKKTFHIAGLPLTVSTGLKSSESKYDLKRNGALSWTYIGAAHSQLDPTTVMPALYGAFSPPGIGGNIGKLNLPLGNGTALYSLYKAHPDYFAESTALSNFIAFKAGPRGAKEQIDAGYVQLDTRWRRLRLNLGLRREETQTVGRTFDIRTNAQILAAGYTLNTIEAETYKYNGFTPVNHTGEYSNNFLSGGAKYSFSKKLVLHVAGNQSIGRPSYSNLAGVVSINDSALTVTVPNPELKPQTMEKFYASLEYALEPAGTLSVTAYELNIKNLSVANTEITQAEAGYADEQQYNGYRFFRPANASDTRRIKSVELAYSQQLIFLPGFARKFSIFGSFTRVQPNVRLGGVPTKAANGGIAYNSRKFRANLRATWTGRTYTSTLANIFDNYRYARLMFDLSAAYQISETYELTLSGRNILSEPIKVFTGSPNLLNQVVNYGAVWTLGVRAKF